jgi:hypothetical protein
MNERESLRHVAAGLGASTNRSLRGEIFQWRPGRFEQRSLIGTISLADG